MAKILYSIQGVGLGHAFRSYPVIEHLKAAGHEVLIVANNNAYDFFKDKYSGVHQIDGVNFILNEKGGLRVYRLMFEWLRTLPKYTITNLSKLKKIVADFRPEIVITDLEQFAQMMAHLHRLPLISIDNQHLLTHCRVKVPFCHLKNYWYTRIVVRAFINEAKYYIINSFSDKKIKWGHRRKCFVVPPIVRQEVEKTTAVEGDYFLVYMWARHAELTVPVLQEFPDKKFIVYGLNRDEKLDNVTLRPFSAENLIKDLAGCRAVICNGGFTFISEALHLRKPIFSIPQGDQFEQIFNALEVERNAWGMTDDEINKNKLGEFFRRSPEFRKNLEKFDFKGNDRVFAVLDELIEKIIKNKRDKRLDRRRSGADKRQNKF